MPTHASTVSSHVSTLRRKHDGVACRSCSLSLVSPVPLVAGIDCRLELVAYTRASMASSSERSAQHGASRRAPPPPDQLASFYKLVDKKVIAGVLCRHARNAELSALASSSAKALFGDNSLVVAHLQVAKSNALACLALVSASSDIREWAAFYRRSWHVLVSPITLLLRRIEADTVLPGTLPEEELEYDAHVTAALKKAKNKPVPHPAVLRAWASTMGYTTLLLAMFRSLELLRLPWWPAEQRRIVESFVLEGLDVIPRTAGIAIQMTGESEIVAKMETITPQRYEPAFYASMLRKWRSEAVRSVLQARGVLQTGAAISEQTNAEFDARQRADIAKHGLSDCALPSCAKTEKTVKEFAGCSGCRSVVYCCLEHQALDWRAHKMACKETEAARLAAEQADETEAGAAAA